MPAFASVRPRERLIAGAAVALVQLVLAAALVIGLRVDVIRRSDIVSRLIDVTLEPPPPPHSRVTRRPPVEHQYAESAPRATPVHPGGTVGPAPSHSVPSPTATVAIHPTVALAGGGTGTGPAAGSGAGGGSGGTGDGAGDDGGTDLVQVAGSILPSDYPRDLRARGVGGRVGILFTVGTNGRVTSCTVTRSSGVAELDALTCRLIQQRFRYRPSTDSTGRPVPDEVEGEQDWVAARG